MTVLVATDLGPSADAVLCAASDWATERRAALVVLHCLPAASAPELGGPSAADRMAIAQALLGEAADVVRDRVEQATGRGPDDYRLVLEPGQPDAEIVRLAHAVDASLVVVGGHAAGATSRLLIGDVAQRVARDAPCDVLVVRAGTRAGGIVVGTDLSEPSSRAVRAAGARARVRGRALTALYVVDAALPFPPEVGTVPPGTERLGESMQRAALDALEANLSQLGVTAIRRVSWGPVSDTLVSLTHAIDAELLVLGTLGRTGVARAVLGSTARAVLGAVACSVWIVRNAPPR